MKIIALDSSGMVASAAYQADGVLIAEYTMNHKRTHSETLLPMLDRIVQDAEIDLSAIDAIAVAAGPGSFTGLRIGAATVKGLALALEKPVVPVPTCEGLAWNMRGAAGLVVPIMDARRGQVYTGIYRVGPAFVPGYQPTAERESSDPDRFPSERTQGDTESDLPEILLDQTACSIEELLDILTEKGEPVTFLGDGVPVFRQIIEEKCTVPFSFAPPQNALQRAASVAALGELLAERGKCIPADEFAPIYLRKSQAEREHDAAAAAKREEDIRTVAEMEKALFSDAWSEDAVKDSLRYSYNHILLITEAGNIRSIRPKEDVADSFLVGEEPEKTAGYIIYADATEEAELYRIAVFPEFRRKGLGRRLVEEMLRRLREKKGVVENRHIFLEVRAGNTPAICLYSGCGFHEIDRRKKYYHNPEEDAVIMKR